MKKVMIAMLIGIGGIANQVNAQIRPSVDQREALVIANQARLRQADANKQRVEQARLNHQRIEQARLKHERIKKARVKHTRIKHARIKAIREDAAGEQVGNQHTRRRYFYWMKRKRTAGKFNSENLPPGN